MKHKFAVTLCAFSTTIFGGGLPIARAEPLPRPSVSMLEATTIADRELQTRGMAAEFILRTVTFVRAPEVGASFYVAVIDPLEAPKESSDGSPSIAESREFRIDMRRVVTFREGPVTRKRVES